MTSIDEVLDDARTFLDAHLEPRTASDEKFVWGEGSDRVNILEETEASEMATTLAAAKGYAAARFDAGFGWIDGPVEYGGRGLSTDHARAYQELEGTYDLPDLSILTIAVGFVGPALLACASPELRAEYLPQLYRGDLIMCQLFSEPNAGSDLAVGEHARGARRRRVGHQRTEGVDVERTRRRRRARGVPHRSRRAQAPRAHHLPGRHARAGRRRAPTPADDRQRQLQRGVPHRRARPRLASCRRPQQGLRRDPHDARQRAHDRHARAVVGSGHRTVRAAPRRGRQLRRPA